MALPGIFFRRSEFPNGGWEGNPNRFFVDSEANYRSLVETATDAIISFDQQNRIILWNSSAEKIFGYTKAEATGWPLFGMFIPEEHANTLKELIGCSQGASSQKTVEIAGRHKNGGLFPIEISVFGRKLPNGWISTCILRDISERRRAEETLRESEEHYRSLFDNMLNGYAYCRMLFEEDEPKDFIYLDVNRAFETLTGLENVTGEKVSEVIPGIRESDPGLFEIYGRVVRTGIPERFETYLEALGQWFSISVYSPRKEHFVAVFEVITERKQMDEELRKSRDELELRVQERTVELSATVARLELVNAELQEFAFVASHDLQEPLRKIQTFCDMARKRCAPVLDNTSQGYLDRVVNSASRMRQLLRDLLEFSRVATRPEPFKKIDLVTIVREAANVFEASVKETGCQIEIENIPAIEADETQMLGLFQNLIGNALKFRGGETPRIKVYGKLEKKRICEIFVKDNGIGFDPQFAELIFKPFQRLHRSEYDGTGMGLAICRKIAERHGGSIRAESEPGKGSTFIIRLPVKQGRLEGI